MAVKTFTTGEVLTASDTNTYLNNGGLVYITSTTASSSSVVNIDNCFSATYTNYRVVVNVTGATSNGYLLYQDRVSSTNATSSYSSVFSGFYLSAGSAFQNIAGSQNTSTAIVGSFDGASGSVGDMMFDVCAPYLAQYTSTHGQFAVTTGNTGMYGGTCSAVHFVNTSYTGMSLSVASGNFSGTITLYGYRKA